MSIFHIFFQLLIRPIELFFEFVYGLSYTVFQNPGSAIIPLSLCVNLILLPINKRAEIIQKEQRDIEEKLSNGVDHIKASFSGDERFMILQTYYRMNNYHPASSLKRIFPLFLQIPFFMAAYHFLSNLESLNGTSFGIINDLGKPDGLFSISGISVNILPILMTVINLISSSLYLSGSKFKDKIQLYGMAIVFLILLYDSPSGLVLYWTLNNLFSLFKNAIEKTENRRFIIDFTLIAAGSLIITYALADRVMSAFSKLLMVITGILFFLPVIKNRLKKIIPKMTLDIPKSEELDPPWFYGCLILTVLSGILIPSAVIKSSPAEFIAVSNYQNPLNHVLNSFLIAAGCFIIWASVFYYLSEENNRSNYKLMIWIVSIVSIINYMFFGNNLGSLNSQLNYDLEFEFKNSIMIINAEINLFLATFLYIAWIKWKKAVKTVFVILIITVMVMSCINLAQITKTLPNLQEVLAYNTEKKANFELSRNGKNVIVFMLDRAISGYIPYLFQENSDLERQYSGFTYYPNTLSYGNRTNNGSPALFGGYEYTPEIINKRDKESLESKQNEALRVMPVLFSNAGYKVTVCDPPYAGYSWIPDLSIYDDYPDIRKFNTTNGQFVETENATEISEHIWERNFFCFSIMKMSPLVFQPGLYQDGTYFDPNSFQNIFTQVQYSSGISKAIGIRNDFIDNFAVLQALPDMTRISDGLENTFLMIQNSSTHNNMILPEPSYLPEMIVDNTEYDNANQWRFMIDGRVLKVETSYQMSHYQCNMASLIQIGKWLEYLKKEGVYDNTRIIIVSDHGWPMEQFDDMILGTDDIRAYNPDDIMTYNPLFMVKDFNSDDFVTDYQFMTNADAPSIAIKDLIENAKNPFTGKIIDDSAKSNDKQYVMYTDDWSTDTNNGNTFLPGLWFEFSGESIFDQSNWKKIGVH